MLQNRDQGNPPRPYPPTAKIIINWPRRGFERAGDGGRKRSPGARSETGPNFHVIPTVLAFDSRRGPPPALVPYHRAELNDAIFIATARVHSHAKISRRL
ncbi:hypothetical protein EVAR_77179_1 [Eumeta japonica]|uniref:Uncharacterized protein n=1 Tax=Eumeta variegata TaxID=151549 RepID=A0A4C1T2S8_EUMVA|nr:hypothetical protein EVAR_77179_1 [Eumeta japonica]